MDHFTEEEMQPFLREPSKLHVPLRKELFGPITYEDQHRDAVPTVKNTLRKKAAVEGKTRKGKKLTPVVQDLPAAYDGKPLQKTIVQRPVWFTAERSTKRREHITLR